MSVPLHVLVIGGGIGGLCLAQGLRQAGVSVAVYERDRTPTDWVEGYRIHINPTGSRALNECLPPPLWQAFLDAAGEPSAGLGFLTEQMRVLLFVELQTADGSDDPARGHHPIGRLALRQLLLGGLGDVVHFAKPLVRYERQPDGKVRACFADGTAAEGDVLVGADGVGSKVRRQYLPHAQVVNTGVVGLGGQLPLTARTRARLPRPLSTWMNVILPPKGSGMFVAQLVHQPGRACGGNGEFASPRSGPLDNGQWAVPCSRPLGDDGHDYAFWALGAPRDRYGSSGDLRCLDGAALQRLALRLIEGWHPDLRWMVAESDPRTVAAVPIQTAVPVQPWETSNVTLLGDAIHTMTPLQGLGGNTALRDASLLYRKLVAVDRGESELLPAIHAYETAMLDYGSAAVRVSLRAARMSASDNGLGRAAFMTLLRVSNAVPPLKQRLFGTNG
jgi:2-polyprenyl-6-methoxyphenol hydroxylase-like FAD-dependent oxidoreductase